MNWPQFINTLIFVFGTLLSIVCGVYFSRLWIQRLPEHTRLALEQFARQAVLQVEQTNRDLSGKAKKQIAVTSVLKLFAAFGLPVPPMEAVDIAIEAAVFLINRGIATAIESDNPPRIEASKIESPRQG
jgi:LL-H family phage holin